MRILIVGSGGREHALLWKLRRDAPEATFHVTRPNGGMADECAPVDIDPGAAEQLSAWARKRRIDLAVIGPEGPLATGLADRMAERGVPVFGPTAAAARIESSKAFAKELMAGADVPTAACEVHTDPDRAAAYIEAQRGPQVVKASGLAAGKGAIVCDTRSQAAQAAREMLGGSFGAAGRRIVIEERMEGEELSVFCIADGEDYVMLLPSQDHKRAGEGDTGPNTGGMGAYAPVGLATAALLDEVGERIVAPTLRALAEAGAPFRGLLYPGLMITSEGPKVVEFNCRFGDPETQAVLPLLSSSLLDLMMAVASGEGLRGRAPVFSGQSAVSTVLAASGYPGSYQKGEPIEIPPLGERVHVFHAGSATGPSGLVTSGGRVLAVTAVAPDFADARRASRAAANAISFAGKHFRSDIGWREERRRAGG